MPSIIYSHYHSIEFFNYNKKLNFKEYLTIINLHGRFFHKISSESALTSSVKKSQSINSNPLPDPNSFIFFLDVPY